MREISHYYWLAWFLVGFGLPEALAVKYKEIDTLSATWVWLRDIVPTWASLLLSGALSAALIWLATVHWIWRIWDKPGFDVVERAIVAVGFLSGLLGAFAVNKKKRNSDESK